jgi:four helix bundle protein
MIMFSVRVLFLGMSKFILLSIMSYRSLEIWKLARKQSIEIHEMSLLLPKFELYEVGQQIRRSCKSVRSSIVEGYGRKRYKADYVRFLVYAQASNDETINHLETLYETNSLTDSIRYFQLRQQAIQLGKMINTFIGVVEKF